MKPKVVWRFTLRQDPRYSTSDWATPTYHLTLCQSGLRRWFDIPKDCEKIYFCLSKAPVDGAYKIKTATRNSTKWGFRLNGVKVEGISHFVHSPRLFDRVCAICGKYDSGVGPLWAWVEYDA